ncbi:hypothetical protein WJ972_15600 [Achromobacter insuavis]
MTNHPNPNSAAQAATSNTAQHVLTDEQIDAIAYIGRLSGDGLRGFARKLEAVLLSAARPCSRGGGGAGTAGRA